MQRLGVLGSCLLALTMLPRSAGQRRQLGPRLASVAEIEAELAAAYAREQPPGTAVFTASGLTKTPTVEDMDPAPLTTVPSFADVEQLVAPACEATIGPGCAVLTRGYSRLRAQESVVPPYLECDACGAIAWQLRDGIHRANIPADAPPGTVNLFPEKLWWRHRDMAFADVCRPSTFAPYSLEAIELDGDETGWVLDGAGAEGVDFAGVQLRDPGFLQHAMARRCAEVVQEIGAPELHFMLVGQPWSSSAVDDALRTSVCADASQWCRHNSDNIPPANSTQRGHRQKKRNRKHRLSARDRTGSGSTPFSAGSATGPYTAAIWSLESGPTPSITSLFHGGDECAYGWTGPDCLECTDGFAGEFCDETTSSQSR